MNRKIRAIGCGLLTCLWLTLTAFAWFGPSREISQAERRPLEQMPPIKGTALWDGSFMKDFENIPWTSSRPGIPSGN